MKVVKVSSDEFIVTVNQGTEVASKEYALEAKQAVVEAEQAVVDAEAQVTLAQQAVTDAQGQVSLAAAQVDLAEAQVTLATAQANDSSQSAAESLASKNEAASILANTLTGGGVSGQIGFWNGVKNLIGNAELLWDSINKRLDVIGFIKVSKSYTNSSDLGVVSEGSIPGINIRSTSRGRFSMLCNFITNNTTSFMTGVDTNHPNKIAIQLDHENEYVGVGVNYPTVKLDVGGKARIRDIANAVGNIANYSATGVLQQRTPLETASDILKALPTYNASVSQTLTHNASGVIEWT